VTAVNDVPISNDDSYSTVEDTPLIVPAAGVLTNDTDIESSPLTTILVTDVTSGALTLNANGSFSYTPNSNFNGVDSFTYKANDGILDSNNATVTINVTAVNEGPIAVDDEASTNVGDPVVIDVLSNDSHPDNDTLTITFITIAPTNGTAIINPNGTITYTPDVNFTGTDSFEYEVSDGDLETDTANVDVTVSERFMVMTGTFEKSTAVAPALQNITGVGFEPKALLLFTTGQNNTGFDDVYSFAMGFSDGNSSRSIGVYSKDDAETSNAGRAHGKQVLRILGTGTPSIAAQANLADFHGDGFAINWTKNSPANSTINYLVLGGVNLTDVKVGSFKANNVTGQQIVSGVGFEPDLVMFMHAHRATEAGMAPNAYMSYGFAKSPTERAAIAVTSVDAEPVSDTKRLQRTDRAIVSLAPGSGTIDAEADFDSMNPDGFTIDWINAPTKTDRVYYLALRGGNYDVGSFDSSILEIPQSVTGVGFEPKGLILTSFGRSAVSSVQSDNRISLGIAHDSGDGNERTIWTVDRDIAGATITARSSDISKVIRFATENSNGTASIIRTEADLQSFDPDGFTVSWTENDLISKQIIYIVFG
ncbi:MAG: cadherin-like domain-containing protein, partial [Nitrososphaerales archaeon]